VAHLRGISPCRSGPRHVNLSLRLGIVVRRPSRCTGAAGAIYKRVHSLWRRLPSRFGR
jgi:hypothetical protein